MSLTKAQARVAGAVLAIAMLGGMAWVLIYQMRKPDQAKVVVVEPAPVEKGPAVTLAPGPTGVVVDAEGAPVPNAEVLAATSGSYIDLYNAGRRNVPSVRTDKEGRFAFEPIAPWTDLVVRCEAGFAHVRAGEMPSDGRILLVAWGRVEGTLRIGSNLAAEESISAETMMMPRRIATSGPDNMVRIIDGDSRVMGTQAVRADENGRFVLPRVRPGLLIISRQTQRAVEDGRNWYESTPIAEVYVPAGKTARVEIGGTGRPVVGRLAVDKADERLAFSGSIVFMMDQAGREMRLPLNWATLSEAERAKFTSEWAQTMRPALSTRLAIADDGSFRAEDVPAGRHTLRVASQAYIPPGIIEVAADGQLTFTMPAIAGGRSEEPLDVGAVSVHVRPRVKVGELAPALEATKADGGGVKLADYRGKYVLLGFFRDFGRQPALERLTPELGAVKDRLGGAERMELLAVMLPEQRSVAPYVPPAAPGWTVTSVNDWRQKLDPKYANSSGMYLIDPEGKVLARVSPYGGALYGMLDRTVELMNWHAEGVAVVVEKLPSESASPAFAFKTIPTILKNDAGQEAIFEIVDGRKANFGGQVRILNDGLGPRHDRDEALMCTFMPGTLEGRIKADLGKTIAIEQINSYAWYKDSHRWGQVYRVYGSDGSGAGFDPDPKIGTDPATCGWTAIAAVDTRENRGGTELRDDVRGQSGVSIRGEGGPIGQYRYLLFVTFATETHNQWGQTFWSEIDVVGR